MKLSFLIPFLCSILSAAEGFAQIEPDSILIQITFSEQMDSAELHLAENYQVVGSSGDTLNIYSIGDVEGTDSVVVILASRLSYDSAIYTVYVSGVYDITRNEINYEKNFAFYDYGLGDVPMTNGVNLR